MLNEERPNMLQRLHVPNPLASIAIVSSTTTRGLLMAAENRARALWITGAGRSEIRSEKVPAPADNEVLVRTLYTGISRGTEALVFSGAGPPSEYTRMRAPFQVGDFPAPVKYGYINVGIVERGPDPLKGRAVFCLYPHQTRFVVPAATVYPLPQGLPPERAILAAYLETAVNGLWDATPRVGDRIAVVGAGALGCLVAWLAARFPGCDVELIDVNTDKQAIAGALGVTFKSPDLATPDADLVIHTSGTAPGLSTALTLAGFESTVLEMSWFGDHPVALPLGEAFHAQRLTLQSSQVAAIARAQRGRWTARRRLELVFRLLAEPRLDVLITGENPFEELPAVLERLSTAPGNSLCHRITYAHEPDRA
jgi:threonine dehydrogenase-like Zn-dependent dehydrogenase